MEKIENVEYSSKKLLEKIICDSINGVADTNETKLIRKIFGNDDKNGKGISKYKDKILISLVNIYLLLDLLSKGNKILKNEIDYEKLLIKFDYEKI